MKRYCSYCQKATNHQRIRVNAFGDTYEPVAQRLVLGVFSAGMSEFLSDYHLECEECGMKSK